MKTIIFRNAAATNFVEYKGDTFATNGELLGGTDVNFTIMDILDSSDAETVLGLNLKKISYAWSDIVAQATASANFGLYLIDLGEDPYKDDSVTLTGSSGTANIVIKETNYLATWASDLATTAANWVAAHADALLVEGVLVEQVGATAEIRIRNLVASDTWTTSIANATLTLDGTVVNSMIQETEIVAGA